jgi:hypothetical protein
MADEKRLGASGEDKRADSGQSVADPAESTFRGWLQRAPRSTRLVLWRRKLRLFTLAVLHANCRATLPKAAGSLLQWSFLNWN